MIFISEDDPGNIPSMRFNFRTGEYDAIVGLPPEESTSDYLPQKPAAMSLYLLERNHFGKSQAEAMLEVLKASAPKG